MKRKASLVWAFISLIIISPLWAQNSNSSPKLSEAQLEKLVAPIALYPDPLLAQILPASTYPLEIVQAARVIKSDKDVSKIDSSWDPSVQAVAHYPSVLQMMNNKLDWTQQLGQAVMSQQPDVLQAVQKLRQQAQKAGNLKSTPQQTVSTSSGNSNITIVPSDPQVIYVRTYNPTVVYTEPDPMYGFGAGFMMGAWMSMGFAWGGAWGGSAIVNNYNWNNGNINSNNVKNWENNHPQATQDAKNDYNNWSNNHPNSPWSHDNSKGTPYGGGTGSSDYSKPGSLFSKDDAANAQKSNYQNFENQMKNAGNKNGMSGDDHNFGGGKSASGINPMATHDFDGGGDRSSMFGGHGDDAMRDSDRGFDSRGGGGFGGFHGGGGGGFGGFRGGGRR